MALVSEKSPFRVVHTVCSHDCPDSCAVLVTVDGSGRAVKVQGDPTQPVTQGFLCGKVAKYLDRVYAPDRILYPMKRKTGVAKGPLARNREYEAFERVSWDEALDAIATRLQMVRDRYGPESILPYSYAGTIGVLGYGSMDRRFFHRLGASQLDRTICSEAGGVAWNLVYGKKMGTPTEDFRLAKLIVAWGANIHGNNVHLWPFVEQARRNGARLIVIDPYKTRTAALADWHIAIRPGTDGALALGMMHVILREGLEDRSYIAEMTHGFEQLAERVREYTPERVAAWTGMTATEVEQLAREYATTRPAAIRLNYGVQRTENGGTAVRAIAMLPALTGAWKYRGGGGQLSTSGAFSWNKNAVERPDLALASPLGRLARVVNMSELGRALTELGQSRDEGIGIRDQGIANGDPKTNTMTDPRCTRCLSTIRTRVRWRLTRTRYEGGWCGRIYLQWCTTCFSMTRPITPITSFRRRHFWSIRTFRARMDTTSCSCRSRRSDRRGKHARTCGSLVNSRSGWVSPRSASGTRPRT